MAAQPVGAVIAGGDGVMASFGTPGNANALACAGHRLIAFNLINYAAGPIRIRWSTFAWATGIGIPPATILMAAVGDRIDSLSRALWLVLLAASGVLRVLLRRGLRPSNRVDDGGGI